MRKNHSKIVCIKLVHLPYLYTVYDARSHLYQMWLGIGYLGYALANLVEAPEGRGFHYRWSPWNSLNLFGHTMVLGSTQPLTEMSTSNVSLGVNAAGA